MSSRFDRLNVMLYAWNDRVAAPVLRWVLDHTWVTSRAQVLSSQSSRDYWYCAGDWRSTGGSTKLLGQQRGDLMLARCLDTPNVHRQVYVGMPSADIAYGIDGVCHQIANRILWATAGPGVYALTVSSARGYPISRRVFGDYGDHVPDWLRVVHERCGVNLAIAGADMMYQDHNTYLRRALPDTTSEQLASIDALVDRLHRIDSDTKRAYRAGSISAVEYADRINATTHEYLDGLAVILDAGQYERFIGYPPGEHVDLIDPSLFTTKQP